MDTKTLLEKLKGIQTVETVMDALHVDRPMAVYYLHRLKKEGYVKTKRTSNNKRVYNISFLNKLGGESYYDVINENSPIKVMAPEIHLVYGKKIRPEEALIFSLKTRSLRTILAALGLFKKITNWNLLYKLAKENKLVNQIGALYDVARSIMKVRKMGKRFRRAITTAYEDIIPNLRSKDFPAIEKAWKVHIPFNKADLGDYA